MRSDSMKQQGRLRHRHVLASGRESICFVGNVGDAAATAVTRWGRRVGVDVDELAPSEHCADGLVKNVFLSDWRFHGLRAEGRHQLVKSQLPKTSKSHLRCQAVQKHTAKIEYSQGQPHFVLAAERMCKLDDFQNL